MQTNEPESHCAFCGGSLGNIALRTCDNCLSIRVFAGFFPAGISYADPQREAGGDYVRLAFFTFSTLELEIDPGCPRELQPMIVAHAEKVRNRRGQLYGISSSGQVVMLGYGL